VPPATIQGLPEKEGRRAGANALLGRSLAKRGLLPVQSLLAKERVMPKKEEAEGQATEWTPFGDAETNDLLMDNREEMDEEIIELVEVVEEPETRLSIDQFVSPEGPQQELDLFSTEPWARSFDQGAPEEGVEGERGLEGVSEEELLEGLELKAQEIEEPLSSPAPEKKEVEAEGPVREKESEEDVFEKLELEEILEKVEMLKPALEKEWPKEGGEAGEAKVEDHGPPLPGLQPSETRDWFSEVEEKAEAPGVEEVSRVEEERPMDFDQFQTLLKKDLGLEAPDESTLESLPLGEGEVKYGEEGEAAKKQVSSKELESLLEEVAALEVGPRVEEEPPEKEEPPIPLIKEEPVGEPSGLAEFEALLQRGVEPEAPSEEALPPFTFEEEARKEVLEEPLITKPSFEEELPELQEEAFPEALIEAIEEDFEEEVLAIEEVRGVEAAPEEKVEALTELPPPTPLEGEEMPFAFEEVKEVESRVEVGPSPIVPPSEKFAETGAVPLTLASRQLQESIARGVQEMIGDFITKILPEMTQEILQLTTERIEKMVKEIVPEMAEKAIRQEIERIEKGEK